MADPKRVEAIHNAALVNLLKKAQQGKTLTGTDWKELRRIADDVGLVPDLPWMHDTILTLAEALGVSTKSLDQWREKGAPIAATGPWDELAVRLWHLAHAADKRKAKPLAVARPALLPYLDLAQALAGSVAPAAEGSDENRTIKRRQIEKLDLANLKARGRMVAEAQDAFSTLTGQLLKAFAAAYTGTRLEDIWKACHGRTRLQAEGDLARLLRGSAERVIAAELAKIGQAK